MYLSQLIMFVLYLDNFQLFIIYVNTEYNHFLMDGGAKGRREAADINAIHLKSNSSIRE